MFHTRDTREGGQDMFKLRHNFMWVNSPLNDAYTIPEARDLRAVMIKNIYPFPNISRQDFGRENLEVYSGRSYIHMPLI